RALPPASATTTSVSLTFCASRWLSVPSGVTTLPSPSESSPAAVLASAGAPGGKRRRLDTPATDIADCGDATVETAGTGQARQRREVDRAGHGAATIEDVDGRDLLVRLDGANHRHDEAIGAQDRVVDAVAVEVADDGELCKRLVVLRELGDDFAIDQPLAAGQLGLEQLVSATRRGDARRGNDQRDGVARPSESHVAS